MFRSFLSPLEHTGLRRLPAFRCARLRSELSGLWPQGCHYKVPASHKQMAVRPAAQESNLCSTGMYFCFTVKCCTELAAASFSTRCMIHKENSAGYKPGVRPGLCSQVLQTRVETPFPFPLSCRSPRGAREEPSQAGFLSAVSRLSTVPAQRAICPFPLAL